MIKFFDILKESVDLDTSLNRKLLNLVANKFNLNFMYNDRDKPILMQMRQEGIIRFMDEVLALDFKKISELCWLIFLNGEINYLTDSIKTEQTFYVYEVGHYGEIFSDEVDYEDDCEYCDGYGTNNEECQTCQGSGVYDYTGEGDEECGDCGGGGDIEDDCSYCGGSGVDSYLKDEYGVTENTLIIYSNEPNLDIPKVGDTNFYEWYEENEGLIIPIFERWEDRETAWDEEELEGKEYKVSYYQPQGDINYDNIRFATYFRNLIEYR